MKADRPPLWNHHHEACFVSVDCAGYLRLVAAFQPASVPAQDTPAQGNSKPAYLNFCIAPAPPESRLRGC
ncbi:hypothetical protein IFO70_33305 [Phormidium tenue FACHB-886]|nr:hypothetical protein [Phormidium tenue FACHB-886]